MQLTAPLPYKMDSTGEVSLGAPDNPFTDWNACDLSRSPSRCALYRCAWRVTDERWMRVSGLANGQYAKR